MYNIKAKYEDAADAMFVASENDDYYWDSGSNKPIYKGYNWIGYTNEWDITFAEFKTCGRMYMLKRRDYRLDVLLKANETPKENRQITLNTDVDDIYNYLETNPVTGEYMPKPLREYIPLHYRRIKENG